MNLIGLSFNALPRIDIVFRYFITAPLFPMAVALLILVSGEDAWSNRWHPHMLSITHGFTLGFIASVMLGALIQIMPVVYGINFAKIEIVGAVSHALHITGTIALMTCFIWQNKLLNGIALLLLFLAFAVYLAAISRQLLQHFAHGHVINGIKLSMLAAVVMLALGLLMLSRMMGYQFIASDKVFTNIHAGWGLFGWAGLLIMTVSFQVLPLFHVTPRFPTWLTRYLPISIFALLLLQFLLINGQPIISPVTPLLISNAIYALVLLQVLHRRKRKIPDITIRYWQLAAVSLIIITIVYCFKLLPTAWQSKQAMLLTASIIYFYVISIIEGMLLKIMPFLSYTHLQLQCFANISAMGTLPHMHEFLPKQHGKLLFILHIVAGLSLLLTIIKIHYYWLFGMFLLLEFSWLLFLMINIIKRYRANLAKIPA